MNIYKYTGFEKAKYIRETSNVEKKTNRQTIYKQSKYPHVKQYNEKTSNHKLRGHFCVQTERWVKHVSLEFRIKFKKISEKGGEST